MDHTLSLSINGKTIEASPGQTILEVARENGIHIPTLCYFKGTTNVGACRVCVVEVENARSLVASCCMPVSQGMVIRTDTERVLTARRLVVELLWSSGDHNCLQCEKNGNCELQDLVYELGIAKPRFDNDPPGDGIEETNSMIRRDMNKCILCGRCVRVCNEIQVHEVLDFAMRGSYAKVGPAFNEDYIDSNCVFCGACVDACPVGALIFKQARFKGRPWEIEKVRTTCPYCGVGCQMDLNVSDGKIVKVTTDREYGKPNEGMLCSKGRFGMNFIDSPDRLKTPLIRKNGELQEATWDEAYDFIAKKLTAIRKKSGPDSMPDFIGGLPMKKITSSRNSCAR
jgi:NADH dehydrogenase/NADH:ubiquinone oxidoreductase subunit G